MQTNQFIRAQGRDRVGAAFLIAELNEEGSGVELFDNGTHLAAHQSVLRKIPKNSYNRQKVQICHRGTTKLENKACHEARHVFAGPDDPAAPNHG
jgi:hypothetical protein